MTHIHKYLLLAILIGFCLPTVGLAQSKTIVGNVTDVDLGQAVDFAIVSLMNVKDSSFVDFQYTDEKGNFTLHTDTYNGVFLRVSQLGYKKYEKVIVSKDDSENKITLRQILLKQEDMALNEVVVNAKAPSVLIKNDTTIFNAKSFRDGTEKKVEDLLRNIPGIEVDANGRLKYQNKDVERVLVEGDDMFGSNYTLATKNLSANVVDKVVVVDNYLDNPLFKEIIKSDKLIINLKVDKNFKNNISGSIELGVGGFKNFKNLVQNTTISLRRKNKAFLIGNTDNVQSDILGDVDYYYENAVSYVKNFKSTTLNTAPTLRVQEGTPLSISDVFVTKGQQSLLSFSDIYRINDNLKATFSLTAANINKAYSSSSSFRYFAQNDTLSYSDESSNASHTKPIKLKMNIEYISLRKGLSIRTYSQLLNIKTDYSESIFRNIKDSILAFQQIKPSGYFNNIELTKKIKIGIFQLIAENVNYRQKENANYKNYNFSDILNVYSNSISQFVENDVNSFSIYGRLMTRSKLNNDIELGTTVKNQKFTPSSPFYDSSKDFGINRKILEFFTNYKIFKHVKNTEFAAYLSASILKLDHNISLKNENKVYFLMSPTVEIKHKISYQWDIKLNSQIKQGITDINTMSILPIFVDYQTVFTGANRIAKNTIFNNNLILKKADGFKGYYINFLLSYNKNLNTLGRNGDYSTPIFFEKFYLQNPTQTISFSSNGSYTFEKLKAKVSMSVGRSLAETNNEINNISRKVNVIGNYLNVEYNTAFNIVNIRLKYFLNTNTYKVANNPPSQIWSQKMEVVNVIKFSKKVKSEYKFQYLGINALKSNSYFTNEFQISYLFSNSSSLKLGITNPFNTKTFSSSATSDFNFSENNLNAIQRFYMISWSFGY